MTEEKLQNELEALIDATGLDKVTEALAVVCYKKAEHLRCTWQDKQSATTWENWGNTLNAIQIYG
ncbi:hypothetical protein LCGC14_0610490 [marine sediment metagenome]|uniref:Uncharacterized protein n=1 Tax=marine sediment metagenome TaxID=412755 RepID=A0A0F9R7X9_9ZZZZ